MKIKKNSSFAFLFIKLPISLILIILLFEFIAILLSDYRAIRHGLDRKVSNIENNITQYSSSTLLFGDSITKDIVDDFDISSSCCNLVNLTTNRASGFLGAYLLYKRYKKNNKVPKSLIIISTPKFLSFFPEGKTKELYLTSVFNSSEEKEIIDSFYSNSEKTKIGFTPLSWVKKKYEMTIFNLEDKIIYPLVNSLGFVNIRTALSHGEKTIPPLNIISKMKNNTLHKNDKKLNNVNSNLAITQKMDKLIEEFFTLLQNDNVNIFIAWAPLKSSYYTHIKTNNELPKLEEYLLKKAKNTNLNINLYDFSDKNNFLDNSFRDQDHLKIGYWKTYYAYLLKNFISTINEEIK